MNSVLTVAALALALSQAVHAAEIVGRVVAVADGDSITVLDANKEQHKIRFGGSSVIPKEHHRSSVFLQKEIEVAVVIHVRELGSRRVEAAEEGIPQLHPAFGNGERRHMRMQSVILCP